MTSATMRVTSMTCEHCARTVENTFNGLSDIRAKITYARETALIDSVNGPDLAALGAALAPHG